MRLLMALLLIAAAAQGCSIYLEYPFLRFKYKCLRGGESS